MVPPDPQSATTQQLAAIRERAALVAGNRDVEKVQSVRDRAVLLAAFDAMKAERDEALQHYSDQQVVLSEAFAMVDRLRKAESWDEIEAALSGRVGS